MAKYTVGEVVRLVNSVNCDDLEFTIAEVRYTLIPTRSDVRMASVALATVSSSVASYSFPEASVVPAPVTLIKRQFQQDLEDLLNEES